MHGFIARPLLSWHSRPAANTGEMPSFCLGHPQDWARHATSPAKCLPCHQLAEPRISISYRGALPIALPLSPEHSSILLPWRGRKSSLQPPSERTDISIAFQVADSSAPDHDRFLGAAARDRPSQLVVWLSTPVWLITDILSAARDRVGS